MKIKHLLFAAAAVLAVVACNKEEKVASGLSLDQTKIEAPATGTSVTVKVSSSEAWTAAVSETGSGWVHVSPLQGAKGVTSVSITIDAVTGQPRTARVNFLAGLYTASIAISQTGTEAGRDGLTYDTAWKPSEARAWIMANLPSESGSSAKGSGNTKYWIKGVIKNIATAKDGDNEVEQYFSNNNYGNASFFICDEDAADEDAKKLDFECFQVNYLGNRAFVKGTDTDIKVGDKVYIYGPVMNYSNKTPETLGKGAAFIFSLNGKDEGGAVTEESEAKGDGTEANPYNPAGVIAYIKSNDYKDDANVYVAGKISKVTYSFDQEHGTGTFDITEDGTTNKTAFTCYSIYYLGNQPWIEGFSNVAVGDEVVVCGNVKFYESTAVYETETKKAWIVSLNGNKEAEKALAVSEKTISVGYSATEAEFDVLGTVSWTATASEGATVTPSSGTGKSTVKVTFPANADQTAAKEYTVTVSTPANIENKSVKVTITQGKAPAEGSVVVTMDKDALAAAAAGGAKVTVDDVISFTNSSSYSSAVTELRIYKSQTWTVSAVSGNKITKIEFECTASGEEKYGPGCFGEVTPAEYTFAAKVGTWEGSAQSVAFKATTNQVRIVSLTVTYSAE